MIVARQKKKENIAEYLLYMWQIEDIIRACGGNIDVIQKQIIDGYRGQSPETMNAIREWYENLCEMMRLEGVMEKGHLQINKNVILDLSDLHQQLLKSPREPFYGAMFFKTLPYFVELRARSGNVRQENSKLVSTLFTVFLCCDCRKRRSRPRPRRPYTRFRNSLHFFPKNTSRTRQVNWNYK